MKTILRNIFLIIAILALIACVVLLFINVETAKKAMGVAMITMAFHIIWYIIVGTTVEKKGP
jgi:hypothetical protein